MGFEVASEKGAVHMRSGAMQSTQRPKVEEYELTLKVIGSSGYCGLVQTE